jgi:hypothetical protein
MKHKIFLSSTAVLSGFAPFDEARLSSNANVSVTVA